MTKQQYYHLALSVFLFGIAIGFNYYIRIVPQTGNYLTQINHHLQELEEEVYEILDDRDFLQRQLTAAVEIPSNLREPDFHLLEKLVDKAYTITVFQEDSLLFWTNNAVLPDLADLSEASSTRSSKFVKLKNGEYELILQKFRGFSAQSYITCALIPIKYHYEIESNYLDNQFAVGKGVPKAYQLTNEENAYPIKTRNGEILCYLSSEEKLTSTMFLQIGLWLYFLAFVVFGVLANNISSTMIKKGNRWEGALFFTIILFGIRLISILFDFSSHFSDFLIFKAFTDTSLSHSLGDLLINIVLLFCIMVFLYKEFPARPFAHTNRRIKLLATGGSYFASLLSVLFLTGVLKTLIFDTGITFDFENILNLESQNLVVIIGMILLQATVFLLSHRLITAIAKTGMGENFRLGAFGLALVASIPIFYTFDFLFSPAPLLLIASFYVITFDFYIHKGQSEYYWIIIWLTLLSFFPAVLLFKYSAQKDELVRIAYAKELASVKDTIAEIAFGELKTTIESNGFFKKDIPSSPFKLDKDALLEQINDYYLNQNYLYYNYTFSVDGFDKDGNAVIEGQQTDRTNFNLDIPHLKRTSIDGLSHWMADSEQSFYLMEVNIPAAENPKNKVTLVFKFQRKRRNHSKVYTELLIDNPYKNLKNLERYDYAIYKNKHRIDSEGSVYGNTLSVKDLPKEGGKKEIQENNRLELIYNAGNDIVVIIGKQAEDYMLRGTSLFAYVFSVFLVFAILFMVFNSFMEIFPTSLRFGSLRTFSLSNKIQMAVISLTVFSFIAIGVATFWFFKTSSSGYYENSLEQKTRSVKADVQHSLSIMLKNNDSLSNAQNLNLEQLNIVEPLSRIHHMDINLYDLHGKLIRSSEEELFNKGIISKQMDALAFNALNKQHLPEYFQEKEHIGSLDYKSAYIQLKIANKTIAYMGLPYYSEKRKTKRSVTDFMGALMNVYVLLLIVASGLATFAANSITNPIAIIGDKLKQFSLGRRNEPLDWQNEDELGVLILEYNKMIKKLEESADKLAQSEREEAWRGMAKQVAHDIKNPLTPMKLNIQFLQMAYKSDPEKIGPLLERVTDTLIDSIDHLTEIASGFSSFSKMQGANNTKNSLNVAVSSVYELFRKSLGIDVSAHLPDEEYFVYIDKSLLIRVLTNLIKNAEQAIPADRYGKIDIRLYRRNDVALIKVSDNGSGIPEDKKDKVFVPNFTTKSSGTGLGLAISKNIIESVKGDIYFETVEEQGTHFFIELPIEEVKALEEIEEPV